MGMVGIGLSGHYDSFVASTRTERLLKQNLTTEDKSLIKVVNQLIIHKTEMSGYFTLQFSIKEHTNPTYSDDWNSIIIRAPYQDDFQ
jgi:hypothetical protein